MNNIRIISICYFVLDKIFLARVFFPNYLHRIANLSICKLGTLMEIITWKKVWYYWLNQRYILQKSNIQKIMRWLTPPATLTLITSPLYRDKEIKYLTWWTLSSHIVIKIWIYGSLYITSISNSFITLISKLSVKHH